MLGIRHFTHTVPLSTQVYKLVLANLMLGGNPVIDYHPIQGEVEILLCRPANSHGSAVSLTFFCHFSQSHDTAPNLTVFWENFLK